MDLFILTIGLIFFIAIILHLKGKKRLKKKEKSSSLKILPPRTGGIEPFPQLQDFIGRQKELSLLEEAFKKGNPIIIYGEEGVGKTSIAAEFIKRTFRDPKKEIFWFTSDEYTKVEDFLFSVNELLKQKDDPYFEPTLSNYQMNDTEKTELLQKRLNGKITSLFIDQVERIKDKRLLKVLRHLCENLTITKLCLISSEKPDFFITDTAVTINIPSFGKEEAKEFLKRKDLDIGDELLDRINTNPLTLSLLASLVTIHHYPLEEGIKKAKDGWKGIFNEAIQMLREDERLLLHGLSAAREGLPEEGIKYLYRRIDLEDILSTLVSFNLITKDNAFYSIHPQIRSFLYRNLPNREEAHTSLSHYYDDLFKTTSLIKLKLEAIHHAILAKNFELSSSLLLENVKEMIKVGYAQYVLDCLDLHEKETLSPKLWVRIIGLKADLYKSIGMLDKAKDFYERMLKEAKLIKNIQAIAHAYNSIGSIYQAEGKWKEAIIHYEQGLEALKQTEKTKREVSPPYVGWIYKGKGRWNEAIRYYLKYYEKTLKDSIENGDLIEQVNSYTSLGSAYQAQGDWNRAIDYYTKGLEIVRGFDDPLAEAKCYNNLGSVYSAKGDFERAVFYYEKGLETLQRIKNETEDTKILWNLGNVHWEKGDYLKAVSYYEESLERLRVIGDVVGEAKCLVKLGNLLKEQGESEKAAKCLAKAHKIYLQLEGHIIDPLTLHTMGKVYQAIGNYEKAMDCFKEGIEESIKTKDLEAESMFSRDLGSLLMEQNKYEEASQYMERALEIANLTNKVKDKALTHIQLGLLLKAKGDIKGGMTHYRTACHLKDKIKQHQDLQEIEEELRTLYSKLQTGKGGDGFNRL